MSVTSFEFTHCRKLIEHMMAGKSFYSFGGIVKVSRNTLDNWIKHISEFREAKEIGELCQMNKWEDIVIGQAEGDIKGAAASTIFALKNFFPDHFKENTALQGSNGVTVIIDTGVPRAIDNDTYEMDENGHSVVVNKPKQIVQDVPFRAIELEESISSDDL